MDFRHFFVVHNDHDVPRWLIRAALKRIQTDGGSGQNVVTFDRKIGFCNLVEVSADEEFYDEIRGNRSYPSRFVRNRLPEPTDKLCVIWNRVNEDVIRVITAYFTLRALPCCPDEPGNILRKISKGVKYTADELDASFRFWSTHAFVEPIPAQFLQQ